MGQEEAGCGEAKQGIQPQFELSLAQLSPSLSVALLCVTLTVFMIVLPELCLAPLTMMTMVLCLPSSLGLTSCPMLVCLTVTMCSQAYPTTGIKGTELPLSGSVWRDIMGVITYGGGYLYDVPVITVG